MVENIIFIEEVGEDGVLEELRRMGVKESIEYGCRGEIRYYGGCTSVKFVDRYLDEIIYMRFLGSDECLYTVKGRPMYWYETRFIEKGHEKELLESLGLGCGLGESIKLGCVEIRVIVEIKDGIEDKKIFVDERGVRVLEEKPFSVTLIDKWDAKQGVIDNRGVGR